VIILLGVPTDDPLLAVLKCLRRMDAKFVLVDQTEMPNTEVEIEAGSEVSGALHYGGETIDLGSVTATFLRPYDFRQLPEIRDAGEGSQVWGHAATVSDILYSWTELTSTLVVNRPSDMASNNSKPYQASLIKAAGFSVPETLITTDPVAARVFWQTHGEIVYKSISGVRSIVKRLTKEQDERISDVANCPTQFQEYVPGTDYRVHVVGSKVFSCEIVSKADDYRYAYMHGYGVEILRREVPSEVSERCVSLATRCGLALAGIDLRLRPDGSWCCFEVNPSPAFTYYQQATGDRIDEAVAGLLASHR
jgi:predicted ATP-grasp superfamily ATP-dependent carboligase